MIALFAIAVGCSPPIATKHDRASYAEKNLASNIDLSRISLSIMPTATVDAPEAVLFSGGRWLTTRVMGHSAILICHPNALLMFDTGLGRNIDAQFEDMPFHLWLLFQYVTGKPAADQLASSNFCPGRTLRIAVSHLHWDHASGLEDFPSTPVWARPAEIARAKEEQNNSGYLSGQLEEPEFDLRELRFPDGPYESYTRSNDHFGDGVVVFVPLSGHTDGSVGMFVNLGHAGRFFFTGDITWSTEGFDRPAHKFSLMSHFADWDAEELEHEILRVHALMNRYPDLLVVPAHDYSAYDAVAVFPDTVSGAEPPIAGGHTR